VRYATADARISHLEETLSPVVSMVSAKWTRQFSLLGMRWLRERDRAELERLVGLIHDAGCTARFWGAHPPTWPALLAAGVDQIITDDLPGLRQFLLDHDH